MSTLRGLQFATEQMGLTMPSPVGDAYRAGFATAISAVAVSFGVAVEVDQPQRRQVTVLAPERLRLGGGR